MGDAVGKMEEEVKFPDLGNQCPGPRAWFPYEPHVDLKDAAPENPSGFPRAVMCTPPSLAVREQSDPHPLWRGRRRTAAAMHAHARAPVSARAASSSSGKVVTRQAVHSRLRVTTASFDPE